MALALPVFIGVEALLIWCIVRYRKRDDSPPKQSVGGNKTLAVFFAIPAVIVAVLFPFGEQTLMKLENQPLPQVHIKVEGFQWEWTFLYLSEGIFVAGQTAAVDKPQVPAVMELPVGETVQIELTSRDVIHSFFVPDLLFKRDAIPGRTTHVQVHADDDRDVPRPMRGVLRAVALEDDVRGAGRVGGRLPGVDPATAQGGQERHLRRRTARTCRSSRTTSRGTSTAWPCPANTPFTVNITNQDTGIEHNFSIYDSFFEKQALLHLAEDHRASRTKSFNASAAAPRPLLLPVRCARPRHVGRVHRRATDMSDGGSAHGDNRGPRRRARPRAGARVDHRLAHDDRPQEDRASST